MSARRSRARRRAWIPIAIVGGATMVAGCADDSEPAVTPTLPPIVTTASPTTAAPTTSVVQSYEVREGDTLSAVAAAHGVSVDEVLAANPDVASADDIHAGQLLQIPVPATTTAPPSVSG